MPLSSRSLLLPAAALALAVLPATPAAADDPADAAQPGLLRSGFVFEPDSAPFASCHASTLAEAADGTLVVAWFGGTREGNDDVGIWLSRREPTDRGEAAWTAPVEVANGVQYRRPDGSVLRYPTWNPVLFQPADGPLLLFYKAGPSPREWWGMLTTSEDGGRTWATPRRLPEGILGPVKNKPIRLADGSILCPVSTETSGEQGGPDAWAVHFERTVDHGVTWERIGPVNEGVEIQAIQPSLLNLGGERLRAIGRTRQGKLFEIDSEDGGRTWGPMTLGELPNPNSGTDAVTLRDGSHAVVYNHSGLTEGRWGGPRTPLNVAVSDDGRRWRTVLTLEDAPGEYSYPAVIQTADGRLHVTYTWQRKSIVHAVLDPAAF
ncbi:sialidase family protein [Alienimonas californiensis]|uniref:Sialidase B n=1 Tax=Alienimonas californiensis TaxID=2527989 RepID=A0A517P646_9PLAN|nr:sialidase family protein [Alienimonas californiensis]QDT14858.1 Sialidase B precursor [Alienimonas californiensis]